MTAGTRAKQKLKVLITVKTYPIPSRKYDELVCTAGVTETGDFVRLYPINFRDLPYGQQYKKYQWIEVVAEKHGGRDVRKESYRPDCDTLRILGDSIKSSPGNWAERARYALAQKVRSMEELHDRQQADRTSLGIFKPKKVHDLVITADAPDWKPSFKAAIQQARLWETRAVSKEPPRKVPFKFHYQFECDDTRCKGHKMMIEDWEVGALFWRLVDRDLSQERAADKVRDKFLLELCGPDQDTHFFVGTILAHPTTWVVLGLFYPKLQSRRQRRTDAGPSLFDR
ncbi:MAG: hypothetical protein K6T86_05650 [Pirellulales bacterium]|nr:hypothetical protein [Pirellulales bacterium]